jgi:flavodoxin
MLKTEHILIVYFSNSGNTRKLANYIHKKVGGYIIEIQMINPYLTDCKSFEEQVLKEQDEEYRPDIQTKVDDIGSYDVILIGSPIWWFEIAPPVKIFLEKINLFEKKIALFTTHEWFFWTWKSDDNIIELCPQSTILKSITIENHKVESSEKEVSDWLNELGVV